MEYFIYKEPRKNKQLNFTRNISKKSQLHYKLTDQLCKPCTLLVKAQDPPNLRTYMVLPFKKNIPNVYF